MANIQKEEIIAVCKTVLFVAHIIKFLSRIFVADGAKFPHFVKTLPFEEFEVLGRDFKILFPSSFRILTL